MGASITSGQKKQIERMCQDAGAAAIEAIGLDDDSAQRVIGRGDELRSTIIDRIRELSGNRFALDEKKSNYRYPEAYKIKGITEQTNRLRELFSGVGYADEKLVSQPLPEFAEGWFAILRWETLAKTYGEAVEKVLAMIKKTRNGKFYNYRENQLGSQYLRQHKRTVQMFQTLCDQQKGYDILVVPAQFGLLHRGRSVRYAREVFMPCEFGLGAFAVGCMLLTHPERLVQWEQLHIDCAGDKFSSGAAGQFDEAPFFRFCDGKVKFNACWVHSAYEYYGSASGFLPQ